MTRLIDALLNDPDHKMDRSPRAWLAGFAVLGGKCDLLDRIKKEAPKYGSGDSPEPLFCTLWPTKPWLSPSRETAPSAVSASVRP
jgi:hypothetical protein